MPSLLDIPPELRNNIYQRLLTIDDTPAGKRCCPQLLATCKAINNEATKILYAPDNKLVISLNVDDDEYGATITVGNRQSFHIKNPSPSNICTGLNKTVNGWPKDLSRVRRIEVEILNQQNLNVKPVTMPIYQQLFILSALLATNTEVKVQVSSLYDVHPNLLTPLVSLSNYSLITAGINRTPAFEALALPKPTEAIYPEFALGLAVQREVDDFLHLQSKAGMVVRGARVFEPFLKRVWLSVGSQLVKTNVAHTGNALESAQKTEDCARQTRDMLAGDRIQKIKQEALEKIAALRAS